MLRPAWSGHFLHAWMWMGEIHRRSSRSWSDLQIPIHRVQYWYSYHKSLPPERHWSGCRMSWWTLVWILLLQFQNLSGRFLSVLFRLQWNPFRNGLFPDYLLRNVSGMPLHPALPAHQVWLQMPSYRKWPDLLRNTQSYVRKEDLCGYSGTVQEEL